MHEATGAMMRYFWNTNKQHGSNLQWTVANSVAHVLAPQATGRGHDFQLHCEAVFYTCNSNRLYNYKFLFVYAVWKLHSHCNQDTSFPPCWCPNISSDFLGFIFVLGNPTDLQNVLQLIRKVINFQATPSVSGGNGITLHQLDFHVNFDLQLPSWCAFHWYCCEYLIIVNPQDQSMARLHSWCAVAT